MDHTGDADHWHQPLITGDHCDHTSIIIITSLSVWSDALLARLSEVCLCHVCLCWRILVCVSELLSVSSKSFVFPGPPQSSRPDPKSGPGKAWSVLKWRSLTSPLSPLSPILVSLFLLANWEVRHRRLFLMKLFFLGSYVRQRWKLRL